MSATRGNHRHDRAVGLHMVAPNIHAAAPRAVQSDAADWTFPQSGPLSGANGALPWIIFERDRSAFEAGFPELDIQNVRPFMPFRYLVSGGVSMRQLMPEATFPLWRGLERLLGKWPRHWSMFAFVQLRRR